VFGLPPGSTDVTIESILPMIHPNDLPAFEALTAAARASGAGFATQFRMGDGAAAWRTVGIICEFDLDADGGVIGVPGVVRGINADDDRIPHALPAR
jgi:hypothetical protein